MRIISFSADGIKNAAEKGFYDWLKEQDADFVCIQDLRCSEYDPQDNVFFPEDYNAYFFDDERDRITDNLRDLGYYYFNRNYIQFIVDSSFG